MAMESQLGSKMLVDTHISWSHNECVLMVFCRLENFILEFILLTFDCLFLVL